MGTVHNPLDYLTRVHLFDKYKNEYNISIHPLPDLPSDESWSKNLDFLVRTIYPIGEVFVYGSRDSIESSYKGNFTFVNIPTYKNDNGTQIRQEVAIRPLVTSDFRAGVIYASQNKFTNIYPTVDVTVYRKNEDLIEILLCKKPHIDNYCFIGGFVDKEDTSLKESASREFSEEVEGIEFGGESELINIGSYRINDWRYTDEKVMTNFYTCEYKFGIPKASDDILNLTWIYKFK